MDEPTDRMLAVQGLTRREFDSMSHEGKAVIAARGKRLTELSNVTLAAELLMAMAEVDDAAKTYVGETIEGKHPDFEEHIRGIMREYLNADVETSIRDFFRIKYGNSGIMPAPPRKPLVEKAIETYGDRVQAPATRAADAVEAPAKPAPHGMAPLDPLELRKENIARILSSWEKRDVASVRRTEGDIIGAVIKAADDNRLSGVTDEAVCKACEAMIREGAGVQFYMEALLPEHRERLIELAKVFGKTT